MPSKIVELLPAIRTSTPSDSLSVVDAAGGKSNVELANTVVGQTSLSSRGRALLKKDLLRAGFSESEATEVSNRAK